jgi:transposase
MSRDQRAFFHFTEARVGTAEVAAAFDRFASRYAAEYAAHGKPCVVTLDHAPWHTSRAFLDQVDRWASCGVIVHYLPPYCPELNPIEILWRKIKHDWLSLSCYTSYANLKSAVLEILGDIGSKYQISFV